MINELIIYLVAVFFVLGAVDQCIGNKFGFGERFGEGFQAMGTIALAMVGIISLAPVLAKLLTPLVLPVYSLIGADPASFANTILALDMGGYSLAEAMSQTEQAELFSWVFLGTMLGPTIAFTIPVSLGMLERQDYPYFAKGILLGIITVPIGCLTGGLIAGLDFLMIMRNLIIPVLLAIFISIGLWKQKERMLFIFSLFGKGVQLVAIVGLGAIGTETLTGLVIIPGMTPINEGIQIVGAVALFLAGAFPMLAFIRRVCGKPLRSIGNRVGIDEATTTGLLASLAHIIPMLATLKFMEPRGKVLSVAFAVSGAFTFGGHLGFVAGINQNVVFAVVAGKLIGGGSAVLLALLTTPKQTGRNA
ncbi:ethanolamine utilization protein EutH [Sediminibacillus halophilus]|uniref:Ethanolamine transporter n=1 Tax=Sediminibacillus halophilus TaxID=482461 RepID=A0A1G9X237_9BACI|nr:ethanolamine utilization protein EutH [Sediminibacillus halophilus]SDM90445.1 ethanolamine transporter [Sediminibacillus halophilus]